MKTKLFLFLCLIGLVTQNSCSVQETSFNRELLFNSNWKFIRADVSGAEQFNFDVSAWRTLDLPHDYSIEDLP